MMGKYEWSRSVRDCPANSTTFWFRPNCILTVVSPFRISWEKASNDGVVDESYRTKTFLGLSSRDVDIGSYHD
jgi:hypothetical protein